MDTHVHTRTHTRTQLAELLRSSGVVDAKSEGPNLPDIFFEGPAQHDFANFLADVHGQSSPEFIVGLRKLPYLCDATQPAYRSFIGSLPTQADRDAFMNRLYAHQPLAAYRSSPQITSRVGMLIAPVGLVSTPFHTVGHTAVHSIVARPMPTTPTAAADPDGAINALTVVMVASLLARLTKCDALGDGGNTRPLGVRMGLATIFKDRDSLDAYWALAVLTMAEHWGEPMGDVDLVRRARRDFLAKFARLEAQGKKVSVVVSLSVSHLGVVKLDLTTGRRSSHTRSFLERFIRLQPDASKTTLHIVHSAQIDSGGPSVPKDLNLSAAVSEALAGRAADGLHFPSSIFVMIPDEQDPLREMYFRENEPGSGAPPPVYVADRGVFRLLCVFYWLIYPGVADAVTAANPVWAVQGQGGAGGFAYYEGRISPRSARWLAAHAFPADIAEWVHFNDATVKFSPFKHDTVALRAHRKIPGEARADDNVKLRARAAYYVRDPDAAQPMW